MISGFLSTFDYKLIYVFRINDNAHKGLLKIGDATVHTNSEITSLFENSKELNQAARKRIKEYTSTAGVDYELLHTELAIRSVQDNGITKLKAFRDKAVHSVLTRSGIKNHTFSSEAKGTEWFEVDLETAKNAIKAVKNGKASLTANCISNDKNPVIFRPEQEKAIKATIAQFKKSDRMLWNAKMRFGKTLSALEVAKRNGYQKTLIFTHRPVVSDGWFEDFSKIFADTDYKFGSKTQGESIENLVDGNKPFVFFASIQDLRGSKAVGGKFDKNEFIFLIDWDYIVVDEAHEGTQTSLGQAVINTIISSDSTKRPKMLELSGTPFNLLNDFNESEIYTWDYIMEQRAKREWSLAHFGDSNPYEELPELQIYTYDLDKTFAGYIDVQDSAFNFREFFRTWTGDIAKDFKPVPEDAAVGDFVHKKDVLGFLNLIAKKDDNTNYPFATEEYRSYFRHTLWMLPGVKEARALSKLLQNHPIFGSGAFNIVNVAGDGDEEQDSRNSLEAVRRAIGNSPDETYSITLSCGRLTTGVTVPEWTAVMMLAGSFSTSAANYLQTIFRVQTPANINGKMKEHCCVFDFAPDRTLKMVAEAGQLSSKAGNVGGDKAIMGEFLNYCPVISIDGSKMSLYNVDSLLQQLKKAYTDRVVKSGFDDRHIYNDNLLKLDDIELNDFEELKKIIGSTKQTEKVNNIDVNKQGFTDEEYEEIGRIEKKPKKERTPEEIAYLEEKKQKKDNAQKAMSILRGISIRIPLLVYGADVPADKEITCKDFVDLIDDASWNEFMPTGVTKEKYNKFAKYYDADIFVAAGRQIRNIALSADKLSPTERVQRIADLFATFKNPDKETVLTPWRVVNMHMSDCLGGFDFFDEKHENTIEEPRFVDQGNVTADTLANTKAQILEINSKTGLYPLYVTYSIYRKKIDAIPKEQLTLDKQYDVWRQTVEDNVYVICKTPMARLITKRTLLGYRKGKINAHAFDDLINQLREKPEQFREKVLRGSFWNKEIKDMKFDAIVGNPPYQIMDGGQAASSTPIYNIFVKNSAQISPSYLSMIMPARWYAGGKGLDDFRDYMLGQKKIRLLVDFANSADCFPGVNVAGGICYFLWDNNYIGECSLVNPENGSRTQRHLNEFDILVRNNIALEIIRNVRNKDKIFLNSVVKSYSYFGIRSYERGNEDYLDTNSLTLLSSNGKGPYPFSKMQDKDNIINDYKVVITYAMSGGNKPSSQGNYQVISSLQVLKPNEVCTETYLVLNSFAQSELAKNMCQYVKSCFFRFLLLQALTSIHITKDSFMFVPSQDFTEKSDIDWSKSVAEIDQQLYKKYNLTPEEIAFIESMIKPME